MTRRALALVTAVLVLAGPADAFWRVAGIGAGSARTATLTPATVTTPAANADGKPVLTFTAQAVTPGATPGYVVQRRTGAAPFAAVTAGSCAGTLTAPVTTCTDESVAANGAYDYRVRATSRTWTADSAVVRTTVTRPAPTITSIVQADRTPTNAATVRWTVTFSQPVTGVSAASFTLAGSGITGGSITAVTGSGTSWTVTAGTGTGDGTLGLSAIADPAIRNSFGAPLAAGLAGPAYRLDRTAPAVTATEFFDRNANGRVDEVVVTFGEDLAPSTLTSQWTLAAAPGGATLASVTTANRVATLRLTEGTVTTAGAGFTLALAADATGARDLAGNTGSFAARAVADKAGPVLTNAAMPGAGTVIGYIDGLDAINFTFSEPLAATSVPGSPTITQSRATSTANVMMAIAGVLALSDLGSPSYFSSNGSFDFTSSTSLTSANVIRVSAGSCTVFLGCGPRTSQWSAFPVTFVPAASLLDPAGNPAVGSWKETVRVF